jgi:predicted metal-dependent peptidase
MSVHAALVRARAQLLMEQPFFGTLALRLKVVEKEDIETAAVDGTHLFYNPAFIDKLDPIQVRGLVAHEVMHCVLNHMTRRQERNFERWNVACDHAINLHLIDAGFVLPKGGLADPAFRDMSAEAIYNKLPDKVKMCKWGMVFDSNSPQSNSQDTEPLSIGQVESQWQIAVGEAISVAKGRGKLPGFIELLTAEIITPKVPWKTVLWPWFTELTNNDYSWRKPNRAYISEDEYLPSMYEEACGKIAVIFDTSGSVPDAAGKVFFSEMDAIIEQVRPSSIVFIQSDASVQDVKILDSCDKLQDCDRKFKGRGGTKFTPAFHRLYEEHPDVQAIVYLTDLESDDFDTAEQYATAPTLWVSTNDRAKAPFGVTIYMPL